MIMTYLEQRGNCAEWVPQQRSQIRKHIPLLKFNETTLYNKIGSSLMITHTNKWTYNRPLFGSEPLLNWSVTIDKSDCNIQRVLYLFIEAALSTSKKHPLWNGFISLTTILYTSMHSGPCLDWVYYELNNPTGPDNVTKAMFDWVYFELNTRENKKIAFNPIWA